MPRSSFQAQWWFLLGAPDHSLRMAELAGALGFTTRGRPRSPTGWAEAGLIERSPSPTDHRVVYATLTPRGQTLAATAALALVLANALRERVVRPAGEERYTLPADTIGVLDPADQPRPC
ncbi:MAG: hypothetical protein ACRDRU_05435 [Pseudonocardiaceae bacterium]